MKLKQNIIKHCMVDSGMKLIELRELTGISMATLSAVSNGKSCKYETAAAIAKAFNMNVSDLIEEKEVKRS